MFGQNSVFQGRTWMFQKSEFQGRNFCWDLKVSSNGKSSVQVDCIRGKTLLLARQTWHQAAALFSSKNI
jgi:hypothetical protein